MPVLDSIGTAEHGVFRLVVLGESTAERDQSPDQYGAGVWTAAQLRADRDGAEYESTEAALAALIVHGTAVVEEVTAIVAEHELSRDDALVQLMEAA